MQIGRSTGPVDRHARHAQGPEAVDRPVDRNTLTVRAKLSVNFGRQDRPTVEEVGRPAGRPTVGFGRKSAVRKSVVFKGLAVF